MVRSIKALMSIVWNGSKDGGKEDGIVQILILTHIINALTYHSKITENNL